MKAERWTRGLFVRLAALLTLALFPLGAISLWQTKAVVDTTLELSEQVILSQTERAAAHDRQLLERARGASEGLSALLAPIVDNKNRCSALLKQFISGQDSYIFAGYIDEAGMMSCSSNGASVDFSTDPSYLRAIETHGQRFELNLDGAVTRKPVLIVSTPVEIDGTFRGFVSLSIPHVLSVGSAVVASKAVGVEYVTVNRAGQILSATSDMADAARLLPADVQPETFLSRVGETFVATNTNGAERRFAVSALIPDEVAVVGSWPTAQVANGVTGDSLWLTLSFPVLMWFAGISVAFLGLHRLVIRHIYHLRRAMRHFASGERKAPYLKFLDPPTEFEVLETSFNRMVGTLTLAEEKAEQDLEDKTILLREIHHRVKNNLQLIASIMNMHSRAAASSEAKQVLAQLQMRVRGLATVHQTLNATTHQTSVDTKAVLERLVAELTPAAKTRLRNTQVTADIAAVQLGQDQAVTLSMLAAEALTNAVKYVGAKAGHTPSIHVSFDRTEADGLAFAVSNTIADKPEDRTPTATSGIGSRLMRAFASQLGGKEAADDNDGMYRYTVTFDIAPFDPDPPKPWAETDGTPSAADTRHA